jgi:hypothetical protein
VYCLSIFCVLRSNVFPLNSRIEEMRYKWKELSVAIEGSVPDEKESAMSFWCSYLLEY